MLAKIASITALVIAAATQPASALGLDGIGLSHSGLYGGGGLDNAEQVTTRLPVERLESPPPSE